MNRTKPMTRTPMKRGKAPPPRPAKQIEYTPRPRAAAVAVADGKARMVVPVPKRPAVRSAALRQAYRLLPCQFERDGGGLCARMDGTVCCCHSNWPDAGKSMARKADDNRAASGCYQCHTELDQGHRWSAAERRRRFDDAHARSVRLLVSMGLWPKDIPIPMLELESA